MGVGEGEGEGGAARVGGGGRRTLAVTGLVSIFQSDAPHPQCALCAIRNYDGLSGSNGSNQESRYFASCYRNRYIFDHFKTNKFG